MSLALFGYSECITTTFWPNPEAHLDEQFLQFSGLGFVTLGPFHCAYCIYVVLLWAWWGGPDGIEAWSLEAIFLQCFDTVGWVIWPIKTRPRYDL